MSQRDIAKIYKVRPHTIGLIAKGKIFKDVVGDVPFIHTPPGYLHRSGEKNNQSKFSQEQAELIREEFINGVKIKDLSIKYDCSRQLINRIVYGKSYIVQKASKT
jgi:hypothetical protein